MYLFHNTLANRAASFHCGIAKFIFDIIGNLKSAFSCRRLVGHELWLENYRNLCFLAFYASVHFYINTVLEAFANPCCHVM